MEESKDTIRLYLPDEVWDSGYVEVVWLEPLEIRDTEDDNDWVDFDIESIEDLLKYMKAFEEFEMTIFVSCRTEEVDISYTLCNKKGWQHKDKQVFTRIEIKRGVVAEKLNRRVERAIEILQEERIDFGK